MANRPPDSGTEALGPCPAIDRIHDVLRAGSHADPEVRHHLDRCPRCAPARDWLERLLDATAEGPLLEPPSSVLQRAIAVFPGGAFKRSRPTRPSLARLVIDSLAMPLPTGVRGKSNGRRLLYEVGWADVDIEVREAPLNAEAFRVTGQVLVVGTPTPTDLIAAIWVEDRMAAYAMGDQTGLFVFPEVSPGVYRLEIWTPAQADGITIEPFQL
jgi:hypothetical protein